MFNLCSCRNDEELNKLLTGVMLSTHRFGSVGGESNPGLAHYGGESNPGLAHYGEMYYTMEN